MLWVTTIYLCMLLALANMANQSYMHFYAPRNMTCCPMQITHSVLWQHILGIILRQNSKTTPQRNACKYSDLVPYFYAAQKLAFAVNICTFKRHPSTMVPVKSRIDFTFNTSFKVTNFCYTFSKEISGNANAFQNCSQKATIRTGFCAFAITFAFVYMYVWL